LGGLRSWRRRGREGKEEEKERAEEEDDEKSQSPMVHCDALINAVSLTIRKHGVCLRICFKHDVRL
jgi:hypothetical protein